MTTTYITPNPARPADPAAAVQHGFCTIRQGGYYLVAYQGGRSATYAMCTRVEPQANGDTRIKFMDPDACGFWTPLSGIECIAELSEERMNRVLARLNGEPEPARADVDWD
jgi:hypothetical protein